jgi:hypothetical protein
MKIISKTFDKIMDDFIPYKKTETRYIIVDDEDKIIDDAQGYGYKTFDKAKKALWYKYKGGKEKINNEKLEAEKFWKNNTKKYTKIEKKPKEMPIIHMILYHIGV